MTQQQLVVSRENKKIITQMKLDNDDYKAVNDVVDYLLRLAGKKGKKK